MKKVISILFMLVLLGTTAFATGDVPTSYDLDVDNSTITVSGKTAANTHLLVVILKAADESDLANGANYIASLNEIRDGSFFASAKAPVSVLLKNGDTSIDNVNFETYKKHFEYVTSDANGLYEKELPITFGSEDALYLLMAGGGSYENDHEAISVYVPSASTVAAATAAVNAANTWDAMVAAIDTYDVVFTLDTNNDVYRNMKQEIATAILKMKTAAYTDFNEFKADYAEALAYYTRQTEATDNINVATTDYLKTILENYSQGINVLGAYGEVKLDFGTAYSNYGYLEVNRLLVGKTYNKMSDFITEFKAAVSTLAAQQADPNPGTPDNPSIPSGPAGGGGVFVPSTQGPVLPGKVDGFTDLDQAPWAEESILNLVKRGIVNGMGNGIFNPNGYVTREQFVKMLLLTFDMSATTTSGSFADVDNNAWYAPYVNTAYELGIVNGVTDTEFGIGRPITRQDLVAMLMRASDAYGLEIPKVQTIEFIDGGNIAGYAYDAVMKLASGGIINGVEAGVFAPLDNTTRAQVSVILDRLFNL